MSRPMGRPTKLNTRTIDLAEEAMNLGMTVDLASDYCGISRATFYAWLSAGRRQETALSIDFLDAVRRGRARCVARLLATANAAAITDWRPPVWLLERRFGYSRSMADEEERRLLETTTINSEEEFRELLERVVAEGRQAEEMLTGRSSLIVHED